MAFEFNGAQHYRATERYGGEEAVERQRFRDSVKRQICAARGIELVVIHPQDLSVDTMLQKVRSLANPLPLRSLVGAESIIAFLESACADYLRASPEVLPV